MEDRSFDCFRFLVRVAEESGFVVICSCANSGVSGNLCRDFVVLFGGGFFWKLFFVRVCSLLAFLAWT